MGVGAPHVRLRAVPTVKMIDVLRLMYNSTLLSFVLSSFDYEYLASRFGVRLRRCRARAGSRMFSPPETSAVPTRDAPPRAHPLPTLTDRSRFPVPREKYLIQRRSAAQSEPIVQFGPLMCFVLARSSLLFPAPPLPHVAPRPSHCTCSHTFIHLSAHPPRVQRTIPRPIAR